MESSQCKHTSASIRRWQLRKRRDANENDIYMPVRMITWWKILDSVLEVGTSSDKAPSTQLLRSKPNQRTPMQHVFVVICSCSSEEQVLRAITFNFNLSRSTLRFRHHSAKQLFKQMALFLVLRRSLLIFQERSDSREHMRHNRQGG